MIRIVAGTGSLFGSGHRRRMELLFELLKQRGMASELVLCRSDTEIRRLTHEEYPVVLDARDFPASEFTCPVIALDNRNPGRSSDKKTVYHDTIPHPEAGDVLDNCLVDPALNAYRVTPAKKTGILIYAGSQKIPRFMEEFASRRAGTLVRESELSRTEFLDRLAAAEAVYSYFGMTILESLFLKKRTALYSIESSVHNTLSEYLERTCRVPFVRSEKEADAALTLPSSTCCPGEHGYERLVNLIIKVSEAL